MKQITTNKQIMTSREIAEMYGKSHKNVLVKIRKLESAYVEAFGNELKFKPVEYRDSKGESRPEIHLNKSQALFVSSRFDAVLHAKVQKRWEDLEIKAATPALPSNYKEAVEHLLVQIGKSEQLEAENSAKQEQLQFQAPKVEALKRLTLCDGLHNITNTAKQLDIQPKRLFTILSASKWIYRRAGGKGWVGYQDKIQQGLLTHKVTIREVEGVERMFEQVLITPKGATKIAEKLLAQA